MSLDLELLHLARSGDGRGLEETLAAAGYRPRTRRVRDKHGYVSALVAGAYDLVIAELEAAASSEALEALELARRILPDTPFVLVGSGLSPTVALEALQHGALGYVDAGDLSRLGPLVAHALRQRQERQSRRDTERALRESKEALRRSQQLEALGRLAGGVAHDFNNMLSVILGHTALVAETLPAEHPAQSRLAIVRSAADRSAELTKQLLAFGRRQHLEAKVTNLNDLLDEATKLLGRVLGEHIEIELEPEPRLGLVFVDRALVQQALVNLALNARDAMPQGGRLSIRSRNEREHGAMYSVISVADTGAGIPTEHLPRIFEPFFTTKPAGKGTGLGLASLHGFVTQSEGFVRVASEVGRGTTFDLYFPHTAESITKTPATGGFRIPKRRGEELVLLVEDEELVRDIAAETLKQGGYQVLTASSMAAALREAAKHPRLDLLITDVVMPGGGGKDLAEELRRERPYLQVLFMSGYAPDESAERGLLAETGHFLGKPFEPKQLLKRVRQLLDVPGSMNAGPCP